MLDERQVILSKVRLQSAREDYLVSAENLQAGHYNAANNRAYYSIFHAIRAVLALESKDFKKHSQAIGYFNKEYIHTGRFEPRLYEIIASASKARNNSDYEDYYVATKEEADENVAGANLIIEAAESYIAKRMENEYIPADSPELEPEIEDEDEQER
jgi:uncharacterized protein (UPF0332 family)